MIRFLARMIVGLVVLAWLLCMWVFKLCVRLMLTIIDETKEKKNG